MPSDTDLQRRINCPADSLAYPPIAPELIGIKDIAGMLGLSVRKAWQMVAVGTLPRPVVLPGCRATRWRRADVLAFIAGLSTEGGAK